MATARARYDGRHTGEIPFTFARNRRSFDERGRLLQVDEPRFAREPRAVVSIEEPVVLQEGQAHEIWGSGRSAIGAPVLVFEHTGNGYFEIVEGADLVATLQTVAAPATGGNNRTSGAAGTRRRVAFDWLAANAAGVPAGQTWSVNVGSALVIDGLIVLCARILDGASEIGAGLVSSDNGGATWTAHAPDALTFGTPGVTNEPGKPRMRSWSMQNHWPETRGDEFRATWICLTDYLYFVQGNDATTGRMWVMRLTREHPGRPWSAGPLALALEVTGIRHSHAGGMIPDGAGGLLFFMAYGDGGAKNGIVRRRLANPGGYAQQSSWEAQQDIHGGVGASQGYQFIGCAPARDPRLAVIGADLSFDGITECDFAATPPAIRPLASFGWSQPRSDDATTHSAEAGGAPVTTESFNLKCGRPELGAHYVVGRWSAVGAITPPEPYDRVLYSPDGQRWVNVCAGISRASQPAVACYAGGYIFTDHTRTGVGLAAWKINEVRGCRPLRIAGGAGPSKSWKEATHVLDALANSVAEALEVVDLEDLPEGAPPPPCAGPIIRVKAEAVSGSLASIIPRTTGAGSAFLPAGCQHSRVWALPVAAARGNQLKRKINTTTGVRAPLSAAFTSHNMFGGNFPDVGLLNPGDRWQPLDQVFADTGARRYIDRILTDAGNFTHVFLCYDGLCSHASLPIIGHYGFDTDANDTTAGDELADEDLSGLSMSSASWTIQRVVRVPDYGWDTRLLEMMDADSPLLSIFCDATNFIDVFFRGRTTSNTASTYELVCRVTDAGTPREIAFANVAATRGDQVDLSITKLDANTIGFAARVGGGLIRWGTAASAGILAVAPAAIRARATGAVNLATSVGEIEVVNTRVRTDSATNEAQSRIDLVRLCLECTMQPAPTSEQLAERNALAHSLAVA